MVGQWLDCCFETRASLFTPDLVYSALPTGVFPMKAVGVFNRVSMPVEVKCPTQGVNV